MTILVIYDSLFGNTQIVAETIAETVKGKSVRVTDFRKEMLDGVSLLVVGCPIHGWRPSEGATSFLTSLPTGSLKRVGVAAFDTRVKIFFSGDASGKINERLIELGGKSVAPPGKFYVKGKEGPLVEGELEKAKSWSRDILRKVGNYS